MSQLFAIAKDVGKRTFSGCTFKKGVQHIIHSSQGKFYYHAHTICLKSPSPFLYQFQIECFPVYTDRGKVNTQCSTTVTNVQRNSQLHFLLHLAPTTQQLSVVPDPIVISLLQNLFANSSETIFP